MFRIVATPLEHLPERQTLENSSAGACVSFEGRVRDHNEGHSVTLLEYEAYEVLAVKEGERILEEARQRFGILEAHCVHRTGTLTIGEIAVWVGVIAPHRGEAFEGCEYIINQVKHRVPIWKKETYTDGDSGWVNCHHCHTAGEPAVTEQAFYARQLNLPELGTAGQAILKQSKVLIVGAGGLGSAALQCLAGAGIGVIGICDSDRVETSNLHRQLLYRLEDLQTAKAEAAARHLRQLNPFITIRPHVMRLDARNADELLADYDWVLDCTDNFEARYALSDVAVRLGKPLVRASIYQYEGELGVYQPEQGSPCLRCLWPQPPEAEATGICTQAGVLGATANLFGTLQAMELIKQLLNLPGRLSGQEQLLVDLLSQTSQRLRHAPAPDCPLCGDGHRAATPETPATSGAWLIEPENLTADHLAQWTIWDLSEPHEQDLDKTLPAQARLIPYSQFLAQPLAPDPAQTYLLVCPHGRRSLHAVRTLRRQGCLNVYALKGGWPALEPWLQQTGAC